MTRQWLGYSAESSHQLMRDALASLPLSGTITFATSATDLRRRLHDEEPGSVGVIIGFCDQGVSDINLAAAIAQDGLAEEVVLAARGVTGSLRSRASCAGVTRIIDVQELSSSARVSMTTGQNERELRHAIETRVEGEEALNRAGSRGQTRAPVVTFVSGRGGLGKSLIVSTAGLAAARWGLRVALCDLDLANGNLYQGLGLHQGMDLASVISDGRLNVDKLVSGGLPCVEGATLWGPCKLPEMAELVAPAIGELVGVLASESDLVLIDTSTTCTDTVAQAMQLADRLIVVHGQESLGLSSAARISALAVRLGVARTRIMRIENGCSTREIGQPFMPRAEVGLETARAFRIVDGGFEIGSMLRSGRIQELSESDSAFTHTTLTFMAQVLEELGCLPEHEEAHQFARGFRRRSGFSLFGRKREVA